MLGARYLISFIMLDYRHHSNRWATLISMRQKANTRNMLGNKKPVNQFSLILAMSLQTIYFILDCCVIKA